MLLVKPGGRVAYASQAARELFEIAGQEPNLERMARQARPQEAFLGLCAAEGQASFSLRGHPVDGVSYIVPFENASAMLVALRRPQLVAVERRRRQPLSRPLPAASTRRSTSAWTWRPPCKSILEHVAGLVPADYLEIAVWQPDENCLVPYRLTSAAGAERRLEKTGERYPLDRGYSGILFNERRPLLILDKDQFHLQNPQVEAKSYPFAAFLGLPLLVGDSPVGTLELASLSKDAYSQNDLQALQPDRRSGCSCRTACRALSRRRAPLPGERRAGAAHRSGQRLAQSRRSSTPA